MNVSIHTNPEIRMDVETSQQTGNYTLPSDSPWRDGGEGHFRSIFVNF